VLKEYAHTDGRNVAQITASELPELERIANEVPGGIAAARAENILCFFYNLCAPLSSATKSQKQKPIKPRAPLEELLNSQNKVKLHPNPADQWVQLEYELLFDKPGTVLYIYDELGRKIETRAIGQNTRGLEVIDTRALPPGLYIAEIVQEGKPIYSGKFMVQH